MWDGPSGELTYSGLRVVEIADGTQAEIVGKLLADQGATVVKVEPPEGAVNRRVGPFEGESRDADSSLTFWTYNTGKRSVVLSPDDTASRDRLIAQADVLITSAGPRDL